MPRKNPTSVALNETVQKIKDEMAPVYGLKNILSAGLVLFWRLSPPEREVAVRAGQGSDQQTTFDLTPYSRSENL